MTAASRAPRRAWSALVVTLLAGAFAAAMLLARIASPPDGQRSATAASSTAPAEAPPLVLPRTVLRFSAAPLSLPGAPPAPQNPIWVAPTVPLSGAEQLEYASAYRSGLSERRDGDYVARRLAASIGFQRGWDDALAGRPPRHPLLPSVDGLDVGPDQAQIEALVIEESPQAAGEELTRRFGRCQLRRLRVQRLISDGRRGPRPPIAELTILQTRAWGASPRVGSRWIATFLTRPPLGVHRTGSDVRLEAIRWPELAAQRPIPLRDWSAVVTRLPAARQLAFKAVLDVDVRVPAQYRSTQPLQIGPIDTGRERGLLRVRWDTIATRALPRSGRYRLAIRLLPGGLLLDRYAVGESLLVLRQPEGR